LILVKKYREYKTAIRWVLLLAGLYFILVLAYESWANISGILGNIDRGMFVSSMIIATACNILMAFLFNQLLVKHGVNVCDSVALRMFFVGQITKYIPGKIWTIAYQISHVVGGANARGILLANIEIMISIIFMTSVLALSLYLYFEYLFLAVFVFGLGLIVFVLLYKGNIVNTIIYYLPLKLSNSELLGRVAKSSTTYAAGICFYVLFCSMYVLAYVLMLDAVFGFSFEEAAIYIILLTVAWIGGIIAFIVPAGIGVREALFVSVSTIVLPEYSVAQLVTIAVLTRFWLILQDIVGLSFVPFLRKV